ncbi:MAG TPA: hypothetical protein VIG76_13485 [Amnibacterium sp.]
MTEVVDRHARQPSGHQGPVKPRVLVHRRGPQVAPRGVGEQQVVRLLAAHRLGDRVHDERRDRHAAPLVGLRRSDDHFTVDQHGVLDDLQSGSPQVDVLHPESAHLAPAEAGVGQDSDEGGVLARGLCQGVHLLVREVAVLATDLARQRDPASGVGADPSIPNRGLENRGQDAVGPKHEGGGSRATVAASVGQPRDPILDGAEPHLAHEEVSPGGTDVEAPSRFHHRHGGRLQVRLAGQPRVAQNSDRDPPIDRVEIRPVGLSDLDRGEKELGLTPGLEAPLRGLRVVGLAVADAVPLAGRRLVGLHRRHGEPPAGRRVHPSSDSASTEHNQGLQRKRYNLRAEARALVPRSSMPKPLRLAHDALDKAVLNAYGLRVTVSDVGLLEQLFREYAARVQGMLRTATAAKKAVNTAKKLVKA